MDAGLPETTSRSLQRHALSWARVANAMTTSDNTWP